MGLIFTEYALMRMRQRDILEEEARQAVAAATSKHRTRKDGRSDVRERVRGRTLLVVYRRDSGSVVVINAMWENA